MRYIHIEGLGLVGGCGILLLRGCDWSAGAVCAARGDTGDVPDADDQVAPAGTQVLFKTNG
eukprot:1178826-Prorocentrum_minimum.AAC.2